MGNRARASSADSGSKRRKLKWAAVIVAIGLLACLSGVIVVVTHWDGWMKQRIVGVAKQRGMLLDLSDVEVSLNNVHLRDARARLQGVPGLTLYLANVDVSLTQLKPERIHVEGAVIQTVGTPMALLDNLRAWQSRHPWDSATPKPEIGKAKITWQESLQEPPFLALEGVTYAPSPKALGPLGQDMSLQAEHAQVGAYGVSPLLAVLHAEPDAIEIGIGATTWEAVAVRGGWKKQSNGDELHLSIGALPLGAALSQSGVQLDDPSLAAASASLGISMLKSNDGPWPYQGRFAVDIAGFTPPHPPELQGFAFGKSTRLDAAFRIDAGLSGIDLPEVRLTAGEFKLAGYGKVSRGKKLSARVEAELKGKIPCTSLASAVATSKLGKSYGEWAARHANQSVKGFVDVMVQVDADSGSLDQARINKVVGIGCGLRPLTLHQLLTLDLPPPPDLDLLRHLGKDIPSISGKLPGLTNVDLPELPLPDWMKSKPRR